MATYRMKGVKSVEAKLELWHGDCLELMKKIPDGSVDMILCDLPYGVSLKFTMKILVINWAIRVAEHSKAMASQWSQFVENNS